MVGCGLFHIIFPVPSSSLISCRKSRKETTDTLETVALYITPHKQGEFPSGARGPQVPPLPFLALLLFSSCCFPCLVGFHTPLAPAQPVPYCHPYGLDDARLGGCLGSLDIPFDALSSMGVPIHDACLQEGQCLLSTQYCLLATPPLLILLFDLLPLPLDAGSLRASIQAQLDAGVISFRGVSPRMMRFLSGLPPSDPRDATAPPLAQVGGCSAFVWVAARSLSHTVFHRATTE